MNYRLSRMKKGLTQREAATILGISNSYLCGIERLKVKPTSDIVIAMRKAYEDHSVT